MMGVHQSMERPGQDETARKRCPFLLGTGAGREGWLTVKVLESFIIEMVGETLKMRNPLLWEYGGKKRREK